jgi:hypothetical protein
MFWFFVIGGALVVILFIANWLVAWRRNDTDPARGNETWKGWDDGHGAGG